MSTAKQPPDGVTQSRSVAKSAGIVSLAILSSRVTGLVREMVMARQFGAGFAYDAFLLGFRVPNLARDLFAEGALSSAFVPTFTAYLTKHSREEAVRLANLVTTALLVIVGALCVAGYLFSEPLVHVLAPGYAAVPGKVALAVHLARLMIPFLLLVALAAQAMGMLNALNVFAIPATASTFFNIGSVSVGLLLGFIAGPRIGLSPIEGMAIGIVCGGALQLAWQLPKLHRSGFSFWPAWDWSHPGLRQIFGLMIPALIGNAAVQFNVMVNTNFASSISDAVRGHDGPVSWLSYAFRFMQLPLGLFGVAFASAMLPSVSRSAAAKNYEEFRQTLSRSLGMVIFLTIPSSIGLMILGRPLIGAVYQGGRFQHYDTEQTALALSCYALGLVGYASAKVLNPAFYALSDARTPMLISVMSIAINIAAAKVLLSYFHFGHASLALSTSIVALIASGLLVVMLRQRLQGIDSRYLISRSLRVVAASSIMAVVVALLARWLDQKFPATRLGYLSQVGICLPAGLISYASAAYLFGIGEVGELVRLLRARIRA